MSLLLINFSEAEELQPFCKSTFIDNINDDDDNILYLAHKTICGLDFQVLVIPVYVNVNIR